MMSILRRIKRVVFLVLLVAAGAAILASGTLYKRYKRYDAAYATLQPKTSKEEVVRQFGQPTEKRHCQLKASWDAEPDKIESGNCVEEFWYYSRISPEQWVIGFNENGLAVTKYHLVSP